MLRAIALSFGLSLATVAAQAQDINDAITSFELGNGMQVLVIEDNRVPVVQHMVWYRAGSADEPIGSSGVAHFLEHLLFKATDTLESGELSATVAANGGRDNAFTSWDYTAYFQRVAADRLELMMQMEADRMVNIRLTDNDITTERQVILEERNQRIENSARALFNEQVSAALFLNHRYGVPIIGWKHEMETLDMDDVLAFYDIHYSPNNAILVVSGDVDPEDVRRLAEKHYGVIPANPDLPSRVRSQEPPHTAERRVIYRDARVAQPYISRSYIAPERDSGAQEKAAALTFLAEILGGGTTSFLAEKLQFDTQQVVFVGAYYSGTSLDDTTFDIIVVPAPGVSMEDAETAMEDALVQFLEADIDPQQLDRIKMQLRASEIYARDNAEGIASRYGRALTSGLTVEDVQAWPEILQAVTAEDIVEAARAILQQGSPVTGWLLQAEEVMQ